jgi:hypothetical protein
VVPKTCSVYLFYFPSDFAILEDKDFVSVFLELSVLLSPDRLSGFCDE